MPLPLAPLLASAAGKLSVKLIGTHAIKNLAAKEAFNVAESVLLKRVMPNLGQAFVMGSQFVPGRSSSISSLLANAPSMSGQLLGKADIIKDVASSMLKNPGLSPGLKSALTAATSLCEKFLKDQDSRSLVDGLSAVQPALKNSGAQGEQMDRLVSSVIDRFFDSLNQYPTQSGPSA